MAGPERQLHFNAFLMSCGHHEAAWRLPGSDPFASLDIGHWANLAQIAERGTFDSIFLADGPALWGHARYRPGGALEPTVLLTALAGVTSRIGLIATASTTYNEPYNLARRFASLDHISGGRAGWNIVTTAGRDAALNFGLDDHPAHRERYRRAAEFTDVSIGLWDSWEDGAEIGDKAAGIYADDSRIHPVDYQGEFFRVRGPLNVPRSPQGRPLLVQAGSSPDGREFAPVMPRRCSPPSRRWPTRRSSTPTSRPGPGGWAATLTWSRSCPGSSRSSARPRRRPGRWRTNSRS
jgi:FMN-dependent oxidoreductase (nitrilotriacetate monooxygenase family)